YNDRKKLLNPINSYNLNIPYNIRCGFIFAGRLEKSKNIDRLIRIYTKLPVQIQNENHFYIAGYGSQDNYLKNLVAQLGYNDKIHFLGNVPNTALIEETSKKKLLVMASSQEGMPTAIAEALSVGVPVVSTNPGDIGLVLKNNYNGYILPIKFDDDEFISSICCILSDYERFAKAAKESSYVFNSESICNGIINDIHSILSQQ
ncbi:MAG: glycosyltransferase family 4 protein, partial [Prevotellaceae bacterium]|nr:glycosyltransferase family 4 protein [Candidatus Colivivens equi]